MKTCEVLHSHYPNIHLKMWNTDSRVKIIFAGNASDAVELNVLNPEQSFRCVVVQLMVKQLNFMSLFNYNTKSQYMCNKPIALVRSTVMYCTPQHNAVCGVMWIPLEHVSNEYVLIGYSQCECSSFPAIFPSLWWMCRESPGIRLSYN